MEIIFFIGFFISSILFFFIFYFLISKTVESEARLIDFLNLKLTFKKSSVKCETFISGTKNTNYLFKRADLYFFENAFMIIGYFKIGKYKFYKSLILLSNNKSLINNQHNIKIISPRKININSFNQDVYIELEVSKFVKTNVDIRLKNLSEEEKELIKL